jgi:hypothetical protein
MGGGTGMGVKRKEVTIERGELTPKGLKAIFRLFLKFRQAIVDAIFVQKNSIFL